MLTDIPVRLVNILCQFSFTKYSGWIIPQKLSVHLKMINGWLIIWSIWLKNYHWEKQTKISYYLLGDDFAHLVIHTWTITDHMPCLESSKRCSHPLSTWSIQFPRLVHTYNYLVEPNNVQSILAAILVYHLLKLNVWIPKLRDKLILL